MRIFAEHHQKSTRFRIAAYDVAESYAMLGAIASIVLPEFILHMVYLRYLRRAMDLFQPPLES